MLEEVVTIPRSLFNRMCIRIGIMSDSYARQIYLDLQKYHPEDDLFEVALIEEYSQALENKSTELKVIDSIAFEIGEG